ncbi:unnamed protein product [Cylicostephanus goldi]|uniref:Cytochrome b-c1 complex subunit 8 n=1 Tax=Cylicostephanus goldi TaxID=71465 RepID=A0A3P7MMP3_CYLGO|nr:unnamed protein product [Cylicostephanus goldi]
MIVVSLLAARVQKLPRLLAGREKAIQVNKGPNANFGLQAPTPGFGFEWKRARETELETQRNEPELEKLERFDRFTASHCDRIKTLLFLCAVVSWLNLHYLLDDKYRNKMRASTVSLAKHFGGLGKMYGEHRFALAPNEQKAFKGFLDQAFVRVSLYSLRFCALYKPNSISSYHFSLMLPTHI